MTGKEEKKIAEKSEEKAVIQKEEMKEAPAEKASRFPRKRQRI